MSEPRKTIPPERQGLYYIGSGVMALGGLLFLIGFGSGIAGFGDFSNFNSRAKTFGFLCFGGIVLLMIGVAVRNVGSRGLAGSGVILDPEKAREDVEPWSRMTGGVINDTLSEVDLVKKLQQPASPPAETVKVRCPKCRALNDEDAKFCKACGGAM